ncbi:pyridoxal phosphate-dependent decarboxylase family protein [Roseateles chitinivorans]|uniref:pyridoxal phosphate-dependent decarboxylase family protein n=1 Tax=Roseateles chitinivorans TaxID=2917965 RepID=UPI003D67E26B
MTTDELALLADAADRAAAYIAGLRDRRVHPDEDAIAGLTRFEEALPTEGRPAEEGLALLDEAGSPATVASNGGRYFGYVVGAALPAAAAADRLLGAWDQSGGSPAGTVIEEVAARWVLDILDLPAESAVGFGTSASACAVGCLSTARRVLLARAGWSVEEAGLVGAPRVRAVVSAHCHVTVLKALRVLGFGSRDIIRAPTDAHGRVDPARLPAIDALTVLCLQAGEVNTGEFDPFPEIIPAARRVGAWVHVDGAFGLWARASGQHRALTDGVDQADSWTVDGHKWLNTPYDVAMSICRHAGALAETLNSDAHYAPSSPRAQRNLTVEFSRKPRGILVWAALRALGRSGVAALVERHLAQATRVAETLRSAGFELLNRVVLNQVLVRGPNDEATHFIRAAVEQSGDAWFGASQWEQRVAFRLSLSSWRTGEDDVERLLTALLRARDEARRAGLWPDES